MRRVVAWGITAILVGQVTGARAVSLPDPAETLTPTTTATTDPSASPSDTATATPSATNGSDPAVRTVTLESNREKTVFGSTFRLSGRVQSLDLACKANVEVLIQRDVHGGESQLEFVGHATTTGRGLYSVVLIADRSAGYVASVPETSECSAGESASRPVLVRKAVSLTPSRHAVQRGNTVTLRVEVAPCEGHEGDRVVLKRRSDGRFRVDARKATNERCRARFVRVVREPTAYRALSPPQDADHLEGRSPIRKIRLRP